MGAYLINLDEYADVDTHWIALFYNGNEIVYFDSFGVEHVPKEIKEFIGNKNIKANIFRVQANDSVMCGYFCIGFIDFMLAGKKLTDYTNLFSPHDFKKNDDIILSYFKNEWMQFYWSNWQKKIFEQTKFWLSEIIGIENYFHQEINQRKLCSEKLSKYVAAFDYIDKILIVLIATTGGVSITSFASILGAPVGIASASFTLISSLKAGIIKILLSIARNKKKKRDKILMLAKSKLNSIETLISQAPSDMEISHKELIVTFKEKDKYEKMKENERNVSEKLIRRKNWKYETKQCKFKNEFVNMWLVKKYWKFALLKKFYFIFF